MSTGENKASIHRVIEEAFNKGNLAVADDIIAANYALHAPRQEQ